MFCGSGAQHQSTRQDITSQFAITLNEITPRLKVSIDSTVFLLTSPFTKP